MKGVVLSVASGRYERQFESGVGWARWRCDGGDGDGDGDGGSALVSDALIAATRHFRVLSTYQIE